MGSARVVQILVLALLCGGLVTARAQDWPNWRGPHSNGATEVGPLPETFSKTENVRWSVGLPGPAASTPIVFGDAVFLTSVDKANDRLLVLRIDRKRGKIVWRRRAGSGYGAGRTRTARGRRSNYASPSPVTDGERIIAFFGNGDLVAFDFDGKELWRRNVQQELGDFAFQWTFSASPTLSGGRLFLPILQRDRAVQRSRREKVAQETRSFESFFLAMDPASGVTLYKHVRASPARLESLESYTTMIPHVGKGGRNELLLAGGDVLTAHDPASGKELWRWGTWNPGHRQRSWRLVPSPVVGAGIVLVCAPKRQPVFAVRLDDHTLAWQSTGRPNPVSSDVPTPAFYEDHFYVLSDVRSALSKVRAKDGEVVWSTPLTRDYRWRSSPTVADKRIWCMNHAGEVSTVDVNTGEVLHTAALGAEDDDQTRSSIVIAHGAVFVRTNRRLWCIGE